VVREDGGEGSTGACVGVMSKASDFSTVDGGVKVAHYDVVCIFRGVCLEVTVDFRPRGGSRWVEWGRVAGSVSIRVGGVGKGEGDGFVVFDAHR
jgi:hypothetical protein